MQHLQNKQLLERYFIFLFKITLRFTKLDQCKRLMLGLACIFRGNVLQFPEVLFFFSIYYLELKIITTFLPQILKESFNLSSKILKLRNDDNEDFEEEVIFSYLMITDNLLV